MEILENVLSIEKMKHLQELGVNTGNASMTWMLYPYEEGKQPQLSLREWRTFKEPFRKEHCIPAFTLLDVLELLPKEIKQERILIGLQCILVTIVGIYVIPCLTNLIIIKNFYLTH